LCSFVRRRPRKDCGRRSRSAISTKRWRHPSSSSSPTKLFPHTDARSWFAGKADAHILANAFRGGTLQGAYFLVAARALGFDCGPMSGFDNALLDAAFFPDGKWKSNFLINLGHGNPDKVRPRNPRLTFDEACRIA
jgi:3-hydroxypropanoate dehydrogenase